MNDQEPLIPPHGGYRKLKSFQVAQLAYDVTVRFCDKYIEKRSRTHDQMVQAARSGVQNIAEGSQASGTSKKTELKLTNVARASLEELRLDYEDFLRQRGLTLYPPDHPALARFKARRCATLEAVRAWVGEEHRRARTNTDEHGRIGTNTDGGGQARVRTDEDRRVRVSTDEDGGARVSADGHGRARVNTDEHGRIGTSTDGFRRAGTNTGQHGQERNQDPVPVHDCPCGSTAKPEELVANAALSLLNLACHLLDRQLAAQAKGFEREGGFTERLYRVRSQRRAPR